MFVINNAWNCKKYKTFSKKLIILKIIQLGNSLELTKRVSEGAIASQVLTFYLLSTLLQKRRFLNFKNSINS